MDSYDKAFMEFLIPMINENRLELLENNLKLRTRYLTVVLEDIYQPQNASAVLRSCDCFGIQDVHIIENRNQYEINPEVELGSAQWLTLHNYNREENNTPSAIKKLKEAGYRIIATSPHTDDVTLENFSLEEGKAAFLMGTEQRGLSKEAMDLADEFLYIPMVGFTESLNISVSTAIVLYHLSSLLRESDIQWQMHDTEIESVRYQWIKNSVHRIEAIEQSFKKQFNS